MPPWTPHAKWTRRLNVHISPEAEDVLESVRDVLPGTPKINALVDFALRHLWDTLKRDFPAYLRDDEDFKIAMAFRKQERKQEIEYQAQARTIDFQNKMKEKNR